MEIWQSLSEHWCKIMAMEYCSVRLSKMLFSHNEGSYGTGATDDDMIKKEKKKNSRDGEATERHQTYVSHIPS